LIFEVWRMGNTARISALMTFHFGTPVLCSDGQGGTLAAVLCEASSRRVTHIALMRGRLFRKTVYLPFASIATASEDGVRLTCSLAGLAAFPTRQSGMLLDAHTLVSGQACSGTLALVAVQSESGELARVVARNLVPGRDILLQAREVSTLTPECITISLAPADLQERPPYRCDRDLQREVDRILFDLGFLHIDLKGMSLRVHDGVLSMEGNISSALRGELAYDQVMGVQGLQEVRNNLIGDDALAASIAHALSQDERTRDVPIGVYPRLGVVRLSGSVRSAGQRAAAGERAQACPGVRAVSNDLVVDPGGAMLYVMSAPEGGEIRDITPGRFTRHTR
jgi:osmotically-inducible protein OsmY